MLINKKQLYLITDDNPHRSRPLEEIISEAIKGGVTMVQFREKSLNGSLLLETFEAVASVCQTGGVPLIMNADLIERLPSSAMYDGVHLNVKHFSSAESPLSSNFRIRSNQLLGYSAHSLEEVEKVRGLGIGFVTLSPIFDTPSKRGILEPVGTGIIRQAKTKWPDLPVIALGGIDNFTAHECITAGADGIAVMRAICSAPNPESAAWKLSEILRKSR